MWSLATHLPHDSALAFSIDPERAVWRPVEHLLAAAVDALAAANWQRGGGKGPKPKPIKRPGVGGPTTKRYGTASLTVPELRDELAKRREAIRRSR